VLEHPFLAELFDPENDHMLKQGLPITYFDFEFEQYTINQEVLRELLIDEIILTNNEQANQLNSEFKQKFPHGVLEMIYQK
jgi:hypothetical protein